VAAEQLERGDETAAVRLEFEAEFEQPRILQVWEATRVATALHRDEELVAIERKLLPPCEFSTVFPSSSFPDYVFRPEPVWAKYVRV